MLKTLVAATLVALLPACSPIYSFQLRSGAGGLSDTTAMRAQLDTFLRHHGFDSLGLSNEASGDLGCGRTAADRITYQKEWRDNGPFRSYHWVWVHEFTCDGAWRVVIVSSTNAEAQAARLRDELAAEWRQQIESGMVSMRKRHRIPLE